MLGTKSKFSTDLIPIANQYQVIESASSFALHVHEQPTEINDKIAQNTNNGIWADDMNKLSTFNVGSVVQNLHACDFDPFQI